MSGAGIPFQGIESSPPPPKISAAVKEAKIPLRAKTREAFLKAIEGLRTAGATVVFDESILPDSFAATVRHVATKSYVREGTEKFLAGFGPAQHHSVDEYRKAVESPLPAVIIGGAGPSMAVSSKAITFISAGRHRKSLHSGPSFRQSAQPKPDAGSGSNRQS